MRKNINFEIEDFEKAQHPLSLFINSIIEEYLDFLGNDIDIFGKNSWFSHEADAEDDLIISVIPWEWSDEVFQISLKDICFREADILKSNGKIRKIDIPSLEYISKRLKNLAKSIDAEIKKNT